jgi:hypothetical protein
VFLDTPPVVGLIVGGAFAVAVTGVLVWVFVRLARREEKARKR